jgi:hypothetical protein
MKLSIAASLILALAVASTAFAAEEPPLPESPNSDIGYESPAAALAALRAKPSVSIQEQSDWIIASDQDENTLWSITAASHPAYPTAVKRIIVERNGAIFLDMRVLCGASKAACDHVVRQFLELNDNIRRSMGH